MTDMNEDFVMKQDADTALGNPAEPAPDDDANPVLTNDAKQASDDSDGSLPIVLLDDGTDATTDGQGDTPPDVDRLSQLETSYREIQSYNTKLMDMMDTISAENQELKSLINGDDSKEVADPEDDKPLTRKELKELLSSPEIIQRFEQTKQTTARDKWQERIASQIKALQAVGIARPGTRVAKYMDEFFQTHGESLINDDDAARKALDFAKSKMSSAPPAPTKQTPPASGGGSSAAHKKSEAGKEIVGTGAEAFRF